MIKKTPLLALLALAVVIASPAAAANTFKESDADAFPKWQKRSIWWTQRRHATRPTHPALNAADSDPAHPRFPGNLSLRCCRVGAPRAHDRNPLSCRQPHVSAYTEMLTRGYSAPTVKSPAYASMFARSPSTKARNSVFAMLFRPSRTRSALERQSSSSASEASE
jgi:hypothetical protein